MARPTPRQVIAQTVFNGAVFWAGYSWTNAMAQCAPSLPSWLTQPGVPFVPSAILFYESSLLLFVLGFVLAPTRRALSLHSQRVLLTTCIALAVFALLPLRFEGTRPAIRHAWEAALFHGLELFDRPYNQLPSLHAAYAILLWPALAPLKHAWRWAGMLWISLVIASAALTWQHNALDLIFGAALAIGVSTMLRMPLTGGCRLAFHYGLAALLSLCLLPLGLGMYIGASCVLVAIAYWRGHHDFLRKRGGRHTCLTRLCYAPYLLGYWLSWQLVRLCGASTCTRVAPLLWVGRRLNSSEAAALPANCCVIDLAPELSETSALRRAPYFHFPLLDLQAPRPSQLRTLRRAVHAQLTQGQAVFVHCAMGFQRSRLAARLLSKA